jgi:hypothetical protein
LHYQVRNRFQDLPFKFNVRHYTKAPKKSKPAAAATKKATKAAAAAAAAVAAAAAAVKKAPTKPRSNKATRGKNTADKPVRRVLHTHTLSTSLNPHPKCRSLYLFPLFPAYHSPSLPSTPTQGASQPAVFLLFYFSFQRTLGS